MTDAPPSTNHNLVTTPIMLNYCRIYGGSAGSSIDYQPDVQSSELDAKYVDEHIVATDEDESDGCDISSPTLNLTETIE